MECWISEDERNYVGKQNDTTDQRNSRNISVIIFAFTTFEKSQIVLRMVVCSQVPNRVNTNDCVVE